MSRLILAGPPIDEPDEITIPDAVIVQGDIVIEPNLIEGYESSRESRSIFHAVLGRPSDDVTLRPASLRSGTLTMIFADEAEAFRAETLHAAGGVFTVKSIVRETIEMSYVPNGRIGRTLDPSTRRVWIVAVDFGEVAG